jgi:putative hydrolase of the HAD superfamily
VWDFLLCIAFAIFPAFVLFFNMDKYQAIIFDLGGTLCRSVPWAKYETAAYKTAETCAAPPEQFVKLYFAEVSGLSIGLFKTYNDYTRYILSKMALSVPDDILKSAIEFPYNVTREVITPRYGAVEILANLKNSGYKLGLISDCFYDVTELWPNTPFARYFDVTVFSCEVGMNKANPAIFKIATDKLSVKANECVYLADGARNELANAAALGMKAIQLFIPEERDNSPIREDWRGPTITKLTELLNLL